MKKSILLSGGVVTLAAALGITALASTGTYAEGANTEVNLVVNPVLSITATESIDLSVTPTAAGTFVSDDIAVNVITNSATGYKLYLSSNSAETALKSAATGASIPTVASAATSENMANNTWGYSLSEAFNPVPASSAPEMIKETSTAAVSNADVTTVTVGAKVDTSIPSGVYSNTLLFTATAKDDPSSQLKRNYLSKVATMQDPNIAQYCRDTYTPTSAATTASSNFAIAGDVVPEAVLMDERDGKYYVVRKLADGNCWMAQNLAYEITAGTPVEISNNDGTASTATPDHTTINAQGEEWEMNGNTWRSYKPEPENAYYRNGVTKSSSPTGSGTEYAWESAGVYYNWYAATGGTGSTAVTSGDAPSSICPKGWRLPTSAGEKSLHNLFTNGYGLEPDDEGKLAGNAGDVFRANPLNFTLSGGYNWMSKKLDHAAENAFYWMSTAVDDNNAYRLSAKTTYIKPQGSYHKGYGMTVRCVNI